MGVENIKDYDELWERVVKPNSRLNKIADDLRKNAGDLEAGKEVNPQKLKKLAGTGTRSSLGRPSISLTSPLR